MSPENKPTSRHLLTSWLAIWKARLNGRADHLQSAVRTHVRLFPFVNQAETEERVKRLITMADPSPEAIQAVIKRTEATLRTA